MVAIPVPEPTQEEAVVAPAFAAEQPAFSIFSPAEPVADEIQAVESGGQSAEPQPLPAGELFPPADASAPTPESQPESAAPPEQAAAAAPVDPDELKANREAAYQERLEEAERDYLEACCERSRIEEEISGLKSALKDAKEHAETCYGRLIDIRNKSPQQMQLDLAGDAAEQIDQPPAADAATDEQPSESLESPAEQSDPDWWRAVPITEIDLEEIEGLGPKKKAKLIEKVPTIGDLEDLRVKAAAQMPAVPLNTLLPKGIGVQSADVITERVLDWLMKNRGGEAMAAAAVASAPAETVEVAGGVEELPGDHEKSVIARARELAAMETKPESQFGAIFEDGQTTARNDNPVTDCGWTAGDKQDSWLLGWLSEKDLPA